MSKPEQATPETPALANLIDREEMLNIYRNDLKQCEEARDAKRNEYFVLEGQVQALRHLIGYHSAPAEPTPS